MGEASKGVEPPQRRASPAAVAKAALATLWSWIRRTATELVPTGLYARALIIIIAPIVLLESVVAFSFMERHWQSVTRRLSEATARDVAALIDVYETYSRNDDYARLIDMARDRLGLFVQIMPPDDLPRARPLRRSSRCSIAR